MPNSTTAALGEVILIDNCETFTLQAPNRPHFAGSSSRCLPYTRHTASTPGARSREDSTQHRSNPISSVQPLALHALERVSRAVWSGARATVLPSRDGVTCGSLIGHHMSRRARPLGLSVTQHIRRPAIIPGATRATPRFSASVLLSPTTPTPRQSTPSRAHTHTHTHTFSSQQVSARSGDGLGRPARRLRAFPLCGTHHLPQQRRVLISATPSCACTPSRPAK